MQSYIDTPQTGRKTGWPELAGKITPSKLLGGPINAAVECVTGRIRKVFGSKDHYQNIYLQDLDSNAEILVMICDRELPRTAQGKVVNFSTRFGVERPPLTWELRKDEKGGVLKVLKTAIIDFQENAQNFDFTQKGSAPDIQPTKDSVSRSPTNPIPANISIDDCRDHFFNILSITSDFVARSGPIRGFDSEESKRSLILAATTAIFNRTDPRSLAEGTPNAEIFCGRPDLHELFQILGPDLERQSAFDILLQQTGLIQDGKTWKDLTPDNTEFAKKIASSPKLKKSA